MLYETTFPTFLSGIKATHLNGDILTSVTCVKFMATRVTLSAGKVNTDYKPTRLWPEQSGGYIQAVPQCLHIKYSVRSCEAESSPNIWARTWRGSVFVQDVCKHFVEPFHFTNMFMGVQNAESLTIYSNNPKWIRDPTISLQFRRGLRSSNAQPQNTDYYRLWHTDVN